MQHKYEPSYLVTSKIDIKKVKTTSSIYHFENYSEMQKLNCILKIRFNNDHLNPAGEKKSRHCRIETK